uniref:Uncharacterized protein n=1 Tax=Rhizophora mucronata TaxID=61149 RepID=A0A2P2IZN1_RHIMU
MFLHKSSTLLVEFSSFTH